MHVELCFGALRCGQVCFDYGDMMEAFLATLIAFFLVEIGDKTQIATIALGSRFHDVFSVMLGTTVGIG